MTLSTNTIGNTGTANSINASTASTSTTAQHVAGILYSGTLPVSITNNVIANLNNAYAGTGTTTFYGQTRGIVVSGGTPTITGNTVRDLYNASPYLGTANLAVLIGISQTSTTAGLTMSNNTIYGLYSSAGTAAVYVTGIYQSGAATGTNIVDGNFIHSFSLATTGAAYVTGIEAAGGLSTYSNNMVRLGIKPDGTALSNAGGFYLRGFYVNNATVSNFYFNSIYIGGTTAGGALNTFAFLQNVAPGSASTNIQNNIFANVRTGGTGKHFACVWKTVSNNVSDYNLYYTNGATSYFSVDGGTTVLSTPYMQKLREAFGSQELHSGIGDPNFVSPATDAATVSLKVQGNTAAEGAGVDISGITADRENDTRSSPPDIGADEGSYTAVDVYTPNISYTNLINTGSTSNRTLSGVIITDISSGVPTAGGNVPRLWFRNLTKASSWASSAGTLNSGNGNNGSWSFTIDYSLIGGTPSPGDQIQYYAVAQDQAGSPYVWYNPFTGASHSNVNTQTTAPTTPASYYISLSGSVSVGSGQTYTTLTANAATGLFYWINLVGMSGDLTALVTSDITEPGTVALNQWAEYDGSGYKLKIQPSAATIRTLSNTYAGSLIRLDGADRVTFDGNYGSSGQYLRFRNTNGSNATFAFLNDATNNNIKNCIIESNNTGGGSGTILFSTSTGIAGNDNNTISGCDIRDRSDVAGVPANAIYSTGTAGATNSDNTILNNTIRNFTTTACYIPNSNNGDNWVIDGNNIYNEAARTTTLACVSIVAGNSHIVRNNNIYQTAGTNSGAFTGISITSGGTGFTVSNNFIGGSSTGCGGSPITNSGAVSITGINIAAGNSPVTEIQGNTISNLNMTSTGASAFVGINLSTGVANIGTTTANTIGGSSTAISFAGTGGFYGIFVNTTGAGSDISKNLISNITASAATAFKGIYAVVGTGSATSLQNNTIKSITMSSAGASSFKGIDLGTGMFNCGGITGNIIGDASSANSINVSGTGTTIGINSVSATSALVISNNTIANLTASGTAATVAVRGIVHSANCALTMNGNAIYKLTSGSAILTAGSTSAVLGIGVTSTTAPINISQNTIHSLNSTAAAAAVYVTGIYLSGAAGAGNYISRNFIHSLGVVSGGSSYISAIDIGAGANTVHNNMIRLGIMDDGTEIQGGHTIRGIYKNTTTNNLFYYNSVYIGGSAVTGIANTSAFARVQTGTDELKNNIFVNNRSNGTGTGIHRAIYINATTTFTSNYNMLQATGTGGYCGFDGTVDRDLLTDWRTGSGQDAQSVYGDPKFINATGNAGAVNLHLSTSLETQAESGGTNVAIIDDFDAAGLRASGNYPLGGQLNGGGTAVDIGADEGDFKPQDLTPPVIAYTALAHQTTFTAPVLSGVSITDAGTGVNVTSGTNPRIYYKRSSDANTYNDNSSVTDGWKWVETASGGTPFSFTIDYSKLNGGAVGLEGAVIQYFIVAQDNATVPNVQINSGTFNTAAASVALVAGNFPLTGTINSYVIKIFNGTYTVGTGGTAPTLTNNGGFFQMINTGSLSGNVTINVISDLTEDGTNALNQWAESGGGGYSVKIIPNSSTERLISGAVANAMIRIDGADRVTFDGQYSGDGLKHLRIRNTNTANATFSFSNDASGNAIQNCWVESANTSTAGGAIIIGTTIGATGNDNITIKNNKIGSYTTTYPANCIYSQGTSAKVNNDNSIEGNEFFNFSNIGIYIASSGYGNGSNWVIKNNSLYNTVGTFATVKGISFDAGPNSDNNLIEGNYIGGSAASCGGGVWTNTLAGSFSGIYLNVGESSVSTVQNNVVQNLLFSASTSGVDVWGINVVAGSVNVDNNTIGHSTTASSIQNNGQWTTAGIVNQGDGVVNIRNNMVANLNGNNAGTSVHVAGIYSDNGKTICNITGNTVKSLFTLSTATTAGSTIATAASVVGISDVALYSNTVQNILNNTISNLVNNQTTATAVTLYGIECKGNGNVGTDISFIDGNFIHSLEANASNTSAIITGIYSKASWINTIITNNMIRLGIKNDGSSLTQSIAINGIVKEHVYPLKMYHNSIYIGGTAVVSGAVNTYCFNRITAPTSYYDDYRDNILVNNRSNTSGTGKHYSLRLVNLTYITACDYNIFQSSGTGGTLGLVNTTDYFDIPTWQTGTGLDAHSGQADPVFVNPTGNAAAVDLHLQTNNPCEGAGISIASVTRDFDGQTRASYTPVDIGADCGSFTFIDNSAPVITFTPLANATDLNNRTLSNVNIYDYSTGIPTSGSLRPRIWYRDFSKSSAWVSKGGTLTAGTSINGTWSFDIDYSLLGLGSLSGDSIEYYIVAQDQAATPNIGYNHTAVHSDVNTQTSAPSIPNGYLITLYSGSYNVGSGERFLTLTGTAGFFRCINTGTVIGDIVLNITSDITEPGTYALNQWSESPSGSNYKITIQPNGNTVRTLSGNYNGASAAVAGLFRIDGADRVTIDGRDPGNLAGGGQYITFRNTSTAASSNYNSCFTFINDATLNTIKYCVLEGSSVGLSCGVVLFSTAASGSSGNSSNVIDNCQVKPAGANLPVNAIASVGSNTVPNLNNTISNNYIYNFFSATSATAGIKIGSGSADISNAFWTISGNSFYQTSTRTMTAATGEYRVIYIYAGGTSGYVITNNWIGGTTAKCGGTAWIQSAAAIADNFNGMWLYGGGTAPSFSVQGNFIKNISFTSTGASTASTGIRVESGSANIGTAAGNVIGGATGKDSISFSTVGGRFDGIYCNTSSALNIRNNSIGAVTLGGTGAGSSFDGIFVDGAAPSSLTIDNNVIGSTSTLNSIENAINTGFTIGIRFYHATTTQTVTISNNTVKNLFLNTSGTSARMAGIHTTAGSVTISGNTISNLSTISQNVGTGSSQVIIGIYTNTNAASQTATISGNNINTFRFCPGGLGSVAVKFSGIYYEGTSTATNIIKNNSIHSYYIFSNNIAVEGKGIEIASGNVAVQNNMIRLGIDHLGNPCGYYPIFTGILDASTTANSIQFNSVLITGAGPDAVQVATSFAYRRTAASGADDIRNNIFANNRTGGASGSKHYSCVSNTLTGITSMDYNIYFSNDGNLFSIDGGTTSYADPKLQRLRAAISGQNLHSGIGTMALINFVAPSGDASTVDLHLNTPTCASGAGYTIPGITTDFDGATRNNPPDIGADEGAFTALDATTDIYTPIISFTNIPDNFSYTTYSFNDITVTDAGTGVANSGGNAPHIWFRNSTSTSNWIGTEGTFNVGTGKWDFVIDYSLLTPSGLVSMAVNTIQYYVTAQDKATSQNVWYQSFDATSPTHSDVNTQTITPVTPLTYNVLPAFSGTINVGPSESPYKTFTRTADGIFKGLNAGVLSGNLTILVTGDITTEDGANALNQVTESGGGGYTITVQPSGGVSRAVSGTNATSLFTMNGCDRVIWDGIDAGEKLTFSNTGAGATWTIQNDATDLKFKYLNIKGVNTVAASGVVVFGATTGSSGNDNISFRNCDIHDGASTPRNLIYCAGTAAKENSNDTIDNCNLYNFFEGTSGTSCGILLASNNTDWQISNNRLYQTTARVFTVTTQKYYPISIIGGNNYLVKGNIIGYGSSTQTGTTTISGQSGMIRGIHLNVGTATPSSVQDNTIAGITHSSSRSVVTAGENFFIGIFAEAGRVDIGNVNPNKIGVASGTGALTLSSTATTAAATLPAVGILNAGTASNTIYGNTLENISVAVANIYCPGWIGIKSESSGSTTISNNTIGGTATNSILISASAAMTSLQNIGISTTSGINTISGNTLRNLSSSGVNNTGTGSTASVAGILQVSATAGQVISGNTMYTLANTGVTANQLGVCGIVNSGANTGTNSISGNFIQSLNIASTNTASTVKGMLISAGAFTIANNMIRLGIDAAGASITSACTMYGIEKAAAANDNFYFNSVYIGGSGLSTAATTYSGAFVRTSSPSSGSDDVRNNIFVNARSSSGGSTQKHYACVLNAKSAISCDYNIYNASGTNGVLFYVPATAYTTLQAWRALTANTDLHSGVATISQVNFANPGGNASSANLHLNDPNSASDAGIAISSVTTDFDGATRNDPPEIGADESNFAALDATTDIYSPTFAYTALPPQGICATPPTVTITVTDVGTGLSTSVNQPRMFVRKSTGSAPGTAWASGQSFTGSFVSGTANSSVWTFTMDYAALGITPANNDEFEYYFTAADRATTPNIWYSTFNATSPIHTDAATFSTPQAGTFTMGTNRYKIMSGLSGTVTLGTTGTYTTFNGSSSSAFFYDLANKGISGNLFVDLVGDAVEGANYYPMSAPTELCGTNYTITIRPEQSTATVRTIYSNSSASNALIELSAVKRLVIDGRVSGSGRYLLFRQGSTSGSYIPSTFYIGTGCQDITVKYCNIQGNNFQDVSATNYSGPGVVNFACFSGGSSAISNIAFDNNIIRNSTATSGNPVVAVNLGIYNSTSATLNNISISNNEIFGFSRSAVYGEQTSANGRIYNAISITGNSIYQPSTPTLNPYPVYLQDGAVGASGKHVITDNLIGGNASPVGGIIQGTWTNAANCEFWGIYLSTGGATASDTSVIARNTVANISLSGTGNVSFIGILCDGGRVNIRNNTIGNPSSVNNIVNSGGGSNLYTGDMFGIWSLSYLDMNITGNQVGGLTTDNPYSYLHAIAHGANVTYRSVSYTAPGGKVNVSDNVVRNCRSGSALQSYSISPEGFIGLYCWSDQAGNIIENNWIRNCGSGNSAYNCNVRFHGIYVGVFGEPSAESGIISRNKVSNIFNNNAGDNTGTINPVIYGMTIADGNWTVSNNQVFINNGDESGTIITTRNTSIYGILDGMLYNQADCEARYFNNTIVIDGTNAGSNGSYAFLRFPVDYNLISVTKGAPISLMNNCFLNNRTGGTGVNRAIGNIASNNSDAATNWAANASNYNFLASSNANTVGRWGVSGGDYSFADWKSNFNQDNNSWSVQLAASSNNVQLNHTDLFVNSSGTGIANLNINTTSQTCWFVNGKGIAGAGIGGLATDYAGGVRSTTYGIGIDIGADEFNPDAGVLPHAITATPSSGGTNTFTFAGRQLGSITWGNAGTVPSSIAMRYYSGDYPTGMPGAMKKMNVYTNITETGGSGFTYDVTLNYDEALLGTIVSLPLGEGNMRFIKTVNGAWAPIASQVVNTTANSMSATGLASFSDFAGADDVTPLPVELLFFTGKCTGHSAVLTWATASETNNDFFTLERSIDTKEWTEISRIAGAGNSNTITHYNSEDDFNPESTVYYRLRQTDYDGHSKEIGILALNCSDNSADAFDVYPNPFTDNIFCTWNENNENIAIRLFNAEGIKVYEKSCASGELKHQLLIELPGLASGFYTLEYHAGNTLVHKKLVKN